MKYPAVPFLLVLLLGASIIRAQDVPPIDTNQVDTTVIDTAGTATDTTEALLQPADTVRYRRVEELNRYLPPTDTVDLESHLSQNPTTALFKSALIPGWGQLGNGSYIKAILFFGLDAWMVASAVHYGLEAQDFRDKYEMALTVSERNEWYELYDDRRGQRNKFTWFAAIVSFVAMFDAYVDAHFSGFPDLDRERDISFDVGPDTRGGVKALMTVPF